MFIWCTTDFIISNTSEQIGNLTSYALQHINLTSINFVEPTSNLTPYAPQYKLHNQLETAPIYASRQKLRNQ